MRVKFDFFFFLSHFTAQPRFPQTPFPPRRRASVTPPVTVQLWLLSRRSLIPGGRCQDLKEEEEAPPAHLEHHHHLHPSSSCRHYCIYPTSVRTENTKGLYFWLHSLECSTIQCCHSVYLQDKTWMYMYQWRVIQDTLCCSPGETCINWWC